MRWLWMLVIGVGCGDVDRVLALDASAEAGAEVFDAACAGCHTSPTLAVADWTRPFCAPNYGKVVDLDLDPAALVRRIRGGGRCMPGFGPDALTDQEVADVVAYLVETY